MEKQERADMPSDEPLTIANGDGFAEGRPPALSLEFVNVGAMSPAEKERNQKLVRSTAMRAFRRRQQSERLLKDDGKRKSIATRPKSRPSRSKGDSRSDGQETSTPSHTDLSPHISLSDSALSEVSSLVRGYSNDRKGDCFVFAKSNRSGSVSYQSANDSALVNSPVTPLGAGRVDPFRRLPADTSSQIQELIDHCEFHFLGRGRLGRFCVDSLV